MDGFMRAMEDKGHDPKEIVSIIHMARVLAINFYSDTVDDDSNLSE